MVQFSCFKCNESLQYKDKVGFRDTCPKCDEDVHVCLNCQFYDKNSYNECREPSADVTREKERSNFCDFFQSGGPGGRAGTSKEDLMKKAEALFKKKN